MLPLQLALAPAKNTGGRGGGGGGGKMPTAVREKALLCVAEAVRGSGSRFVEVRVCNVKMCRCLRRHCRTYEKSLF